MLCDHLCFFFLSEISVVGGIPPSKILQISSNDLLHRVYCVYGVELARRAGGGRARLRPNRSRPRAVGGRRFGGKQLKGSSPRESGWAREVVTADRGNAPSFLNKKNHPSLVASLHRPAYRSTLLFGHTKFTSNLRVTVSHKTTGPRLAAAWRASLLICSSV